MNVVPVFIVVAIKAHVAQFVTEGPFVALLPSLSLVELSAEARGEVSEFALLEGPHVWAPSIFRPGRALARGVGSRRRGGHGAAWESRTKAMQASSTHSAKGSMPERKGAGK